MSISSSLSFFTDPYFQGQNLSARALPANQTENTLNFLTAEKREESIKKVNISIDEIAKAVQTEIDSKRFCPSSYTIIDPNSQAVDLHTRAIDFMKIQPTSVQIIPSYYLHANNQRPSVQINEEVYITTQENIDPFSNQQSSNKLKSRIQKISEENSVDNLTEFCAKIFKNVKYKEEKKGDSIAKTVIQDTAVLQEIVSYLNFSQIKSKKDRLLRMTTYFMSYNYPSNCSQLLSAQEKPQLELQVHIVTPFAEGGNLADKIIKEKLTMEQKIEFIFQILEGLSDIHDAGFVHKDIKPDNILLIPDKTNPIGYRIQIGDPEDLSLINPKKPRLGQTSIYASDEHIDALLACYSQESKESEENLAQTINPQYDVYSFGILVWMLITGQPIYWAIQQKENETAINYLRRIQDTKNSSTIEKELNKWINTNPIEKMTEKESRAIEAIRKLLMTVLAPKKKNRPTAKELLDKFRQELRPVSPSATTRTSVNASTSATGS